MVSVENKYITMTLFPSVKKAANYIDKLYKDYATDNNQTTYMNIYKSSIGKREKAYGYYWFKIGCQEQK